MPPAGRRRLTGRLGARQNPSRPTRNSLTRSSRARGGSSGGGRAQPVDAVVRILPTRRLVLGTPRTRLVRGNAYAGNRSPGSQPVATTLDWAVQYAVPLLGVTGAALYGVLRLAYVFFYLQLRATPEEVGYGYLEVLSSQLIGAIELVLFATIIIFAVGVAIHAIHRASRRVGPRRTGLRPWRQTLARIAIRAASIAVVLVLVGLPALGWVQGAKAKSGYTVRNVYVLHTVRLPVLAVQAVPASVAWAADTPPGLLDISERRCLLYLGQAAGTAVFYDVSTGESIRIPTSLIVISLQNTFEVPLDC